MSQSFSPTNEAREAPSSSDEGGSEEMRQVPRRAFAHHSPTAQQHADLTINLRLHSVWRSHMDRLYDFFVQHFTELPSSCASFVPDSRTAFPAEYAMHQLYIGSAAPDGKNYLSAYHCFVPSEADESDFEDGDESAPYGRYTDAANVLRRILRVEHDGPITRLSINPVIPSLVAVRGLRSPIALYQLADYGVQDESKPPTVLLRGCRNAGFGMDWNPHHEETLAVSCYDHNVYLYDVTAKVLSTHTADASADGRSEAGALTAPMVVLGGHKDKVNAVTWHSSQANTLLSCADDGHGIFWDARSKSRELDVELHSAAVKTAAFHPSATFVFATGGVDGFVRLWDFRRLSEPVNTFIGHRGSVTGMHWAPFSDTVLMTHSSDSTVCIWDIERAQYEADPAADVHCRPELVFQHMGHTTPVRDAGWCGHEEDPWTAISVDDANTVHVWSPAPSVYNDLTEEEDHS